MEPKATRSDHKKPYFSPAGIRFIHCRLERIYFTVKTKIGLKTAINSFKTALCHGLVYIDLMGDILIIGIKIN